MSAVVSLINLNVMTNASFRRWKRCNPSRLRAAPPSISWPSPEIRPVSGLSRWICRRVKEWCYHSALSRCCKSVFTNRSKQERHWRRGSTSASWTRTAQSLRCPTARWQPSCRRQWCAFHHMTRRWSVFGPSDFSSVDCVLWWESRITNRRGVNNIAVCQKALEKASLSDVRHTKQDHLGIDVCLALLNVTHWRYLFCERDGFAGERKEKEKKECADLMNRKSNQSHNRESWTKKGTPPLEHFFPTSNHQHRNLTNAHLTKYPQNMDECCDHK